MAQTVINIVFIPLAVLVLGLLARAWYDQILQLVAKRQKRIDFQAMTYTRGQALARGIAADLANAWYAKLSGGEWPRELPLIIIDRASLRDLTRGQFNEEINQVAIDLALEIVEQKTSVPGNHAPSARPTASLLAVLGF